MQHNEVQPGDTVKLKSGGRLMTTGNPPYPSTILCYWFENGELRKAEIHKVALERITG